jgi:ankyrin repeat protein
MQQQHSRYDVPEIQPIEPDNGNAFNLPVYVQSIKLAENFIVKSYQSQSLKTQLTLLAFQIKVHNNKIIDKNGCYIELDESGKLKPDTNLDDIIIPNVNKNFLLRSIIELIKFRGPLDHDKKQDLKIKFINKLFLAGDDICSLTHELLTEIELKNLAIIYKKDGEADQFTIYDSVSLEKYIDGKVRADIICDPLTQKPFDIEMDMIFKFNKKFNIYGIRFSESLNSNFNRIASLIGLPNSLAEKIKYINECDDYYVDINDSDEDGYSFLHYAVLKSDLESISILINKGINIEAQDSNGNTALYLAILNNRQDIISALIDYGADIDKIYYEKISRSLRLSRGGAFFKSKFKEEGKFFEKLQDEEFCEKLKNGKLEQEDFEKLKIKINFTHMNKTILHYAVEKGDLILIKRLIEMGANPNINSDKQEISPLNIAIENKRDDIIRYLIQTNSDIKIINKKSQKSLLHHSASSGNIELTRYLIEQGLDINLKDSSGKTPLHYAVISGNIEIVRLLLESNTKIDVNAKDRDGRSALHHAVRLKNDDVMCDIINLLLSANINPKLFNNSGYCALHEAVLNQNVEAIELLANNPENTKIVDKRGLNSLHLISKNNLNEKSLEIIKLLQNSGIDIDAGDENGNPVIVSAIKNNQIELVKTLIDLNAKTDFLKEKIIDDVRCCDSLLRCFRKPPAKFLKSKGFIGTSRIKLSPEMTDLILPIIDPEHNFLRSDNKEIANKDVIAKFEFEQVSSSLTLPAVTDQQNSMIHDDSAIIMSTMPQARVEGAGAEIFNIESKQVFRC